MGTDTVRATVVVTSGTSTLLDADSLSTLSLLPGARPEILDRFSDVIEQAELSGSPGNDTINATGFTGPVTLDGAAGNDLLIGGGFDDNLEGGLGNDTLNGGAGSGNDMLDGDAGTDIAAAAGDVDFLVSDGLIVGPGGDIALEVEGFSITGGAGNNVINASALTLPATIAGGAGNDSIRTGAGNDFLIGGPGNDTLDAGPGDDEMRGDAGDDTFREVPGSVDRILDSGGNDLIDFSGVPAIGVAVNLSLANGESQTVNVVNTLQITGVIERVIGSPFNDTITGNAANNTLVGGAGNDTIRGGGGNDSMDGGEGTDQLVESGNINFTLSDTGLTGLGNDVLSGIERAQLTGGDSANTIAADAFSGRVTILGGAGDDSLRGASGDDSINGGIGNDTLVGGLNNDTLRGGAGDDVLNDTQGSDDLDGEDGCDTINSVLELGCQPAAGVSIVQPGGTSVSEAGGTDTFTVRLNTAPTANVTITLEPDAQLGLFTTELTFTPGNFATPQTVTVAAKGDAVAEGTHAGTVAFSATSGDPIYDGIAITGLTAEIADDDTAGVTITQSGGATSVTEGAGNDTYTIVLTSQPTANVTIDIDGGGELTVSPTTVTFTPADFAVPRLVTVAAVDDAVAEGTHAATITHAITSGDAIYAAINVAGVQVTITDNDSPAVVIVPSGGSTDVSEAGVSDTYSVVLTTSPTATVTISFVLDGQITLSAASLVFTPDNFGTPQVVTVTAVDDAVQEGNHTSIIRHSAQSQDGNYNGIAVADLTVNVADNDQPDVIGPQVTLVQLVPAGKTVSVVRLFFNEDLAVAAAQDVANYQLTLAGRDKRFDTPDDQVRPIASAVYNAAARSVDLTPAVPIKQKFFFRVFVNGTTSVTDVFGNRVDGDFDGTAGGNFIVLAALGAKLAYTDSNGDKVSFALKGGGVMELLRAANGEGQHLRLVNATAKSVLSGRVKRGKVSPPADGVTTLRTLSGTAGIRANRLTNPPFIIGAISANVLDSLLAAGNLSALPQLAG